MKKRKWTFVAAGTAAVAIFTVLVFIPRTTVTAGNEEAKRPTDEAAIREASQALARSFQKGDARAIGDFFTDEGEYIDEDNPPIHGREALAKAYGTFFAKKPDLKVESKTNSVRFLGKDTALEEGTFTVTAKNSASNSSRYSTLYVRQDGKWLIAVLKEWGDETTERANLQDLAWLIGTWETDSADVKASTTYEWTETKAFIKARYSVAPKKEGEKGSSGTQVIGVDPASGSIRGWLFDSEGGIGESSWTYDGQRWVIDSAGTLANGADTTAQNLLTRNGDDSFTWRSVRRTMNGERLPDLNAVKVKRISSKP